MVLAADMGIESLARVKIEEMNPLYSKNGTSVTGSFCTFTFTRGSN